VSEKELERAIARAMADLAKPPFLVQPESGLLIEDEDNVPCLTSSTELSEPARKSRA
jgi:hypothetical protein